jgi:uncharacterized protein YggE
MLRFRRPFLLALVLLAASAIAGVAQPQIGRSADTPAKTITVSGHGTVTTVPDRASFDFAVETRAQTATAAMTRNGDAAAAIAAAVKGAGVAAADLRTSLVSLMPQTDENGRTITGYIASTTVSAKTTIAKAGGIVDAAVDAGATSVYGPNLSRSDEDALYRKALANAVSDAKEKASALAAAAGLALGGVQSIVEGGGAPQPVPFAAKAADASVAIEPGTQLVAADVTVTYAAG